MLSILSAFLLLLSPVCIFAQMPDTSRIAPVVRALLNEGMKTNGAYSLLQELVAAAPHRLSGSRDAARAVALTEAMMRRLGFSRVHQESVMVPHWERGVVEEAIVQGAKPYRLAVCALGGSVATKERGLAAGVVEVHSFDELHALGAAARGKIVFFNRPMDPTLVNTFDAYGGAVDQRSGGAVEAAKAGAVAALVRSMTMRHDRVPHTGAMGYRDGVPKVPAAAISLVDADSLSHFLRKDPSLKVLLRLDCQTLGDAPSANVMGELRGSEEPDEVILVGGHLDCWDKGQGAHDDGAGIMQAIEALRLLRATGLPLLRTVRAVIFMNEENGNRGGREYVAAPARRAEHHVAAIESDRGGFAPRGFFVDADSLVALKAFRWERIFAMLGAGCFERGHGGVDISPLVRTGVPGFGLNVDCQRYFDVHHSDNDTIDAVNPREIELGAVAEALFCYLLANEGP